MSGWLLVRTPAEPTRLVDLGARPVVTIGRSTDNDLVIADEQVSRRHALVEVVDGVARLVDQGSRNGTLLNGSRCDEPTALQPGDMVQVGWCCIWYSTDPPHQAPRKAASRQASS